jgi:hypothetical protein
MSSAPAVLEPQEDSRRNSDPCRPGPLTGLPNNLYPGLLPNTLPFLPFLTPCPIALHGSQSPERDDLRSTQIPVTHTVEPLVRPGNFTIPDQLHLRLVRDRLEVGMEDRGLFFACLVVTVPVGLSLRIERLGRSARRRKRRASHAPHRTAPHRTAPHRDAGTAAAELDRASRSGVGSSTQAIHLRRGATCSFRPTHMGQLVLLLWSQLEVLEEEDGVLRGSAGCGTRGLGGPRRAALGRGVQRLGGHEVRAVELGGYEVRGRGIVM